MRCLECDTLLDDCLEDCPRCGAAADGGVEPDAEAGVDSVRRLVQRALGDQYRLLSVLGRGGMGVVYLARQSGLERHVAVKVLSPAIAAPESRERFRREARMAAGLTHPAILPVYAFGEAGKLPYIVMGYVRSETLADLLRHEPKVPLDRARRIIADLASALDYAHRHGVVHRDIKPANILLEDESDRAILMDFGIAKSHLADGAMTATGLAVGTPKYMSPEQAIGDRDLDGRSDLYSLGIVAYEMLAGFAPFDGLSELRPGRARTAPEPLCKVAPEVPEDMSNAIMRCLALDPDDRFADARSFGIAVKRGSAEAGVPDELREMAGFGTWALLWLVVWGAVATRALMDGAGSIMLVLSALLVPVGFALQGWNIHRAGFGVRQILRVGFWPPKWWGLWWPRQLRRPDDMWHELPRSARIGRIVLSLFFVATPCLAYAERLAASAGANALTQNILRGAGYALLVGTAIAITALALRWRHHGMDTDQLARWLVGSTTSGSFWRQPRISPLLRAADDARPGAPATPHEYLRAISDAADALTGAARAPGCDAVVAARTLLAGIEALDAELVALRRDADPMDVMRVEDRLAMLGRNSTLDDLDQEQMRSLLTGQLEVFARLTARQEQVVNQRGVLIDRLRSLWTAVRQLGAADATPTVLASSVESLRELHLAIEREVVHRRSSATRATTTEARPTVAERGADDTSVHRGRA